jgi:glycosyltransferase involved in cell wall biosynthesis
LHIGNVANNAYKNARLLNEAGLDCDVLCHDYYHIMATPEWEDADIQGTIDDHFNPNWSAVNLNGFQRPRWFAQGQMQLCLRYLLARRRNEDKRARLWWFLLAAGRRARCYPAYRVLAPVAQAALTASRRLFIGAPRRLLRYARALLCLATRSAATPGAGAPPGSAAEFTDRVLHLVAEFGRLFPERPDACTLKDLAAYKPLYRRWQALLREYDLIQAYATAPFWPLLCGQRPYIGYEHGTLRDIPYAPTAEGRLTALGYALADGVFITNGDCQAAIPRLHLTNAAPMIHPIDERAYQDDGLPDRELHREMNCEYLFLCTLRHDWAVKGTDLYLRALPRLAGRLGRSFKLLLTRWGTQVEDSKELIARLGATDLVVWMEPVPRRALVQLMKQVDVLYDQTALPHFGATAPEGIAAGLPVLMSYKPESTSWIAREPAPILPVFTEEDVVAQTVKALDPAWRKTYKSRARRWIAEYHSARRVVDEHFKMYQKCLAEPASEGYADAPQAGTNYPEVA